MVLGFECVCRLLGYLELGAGVGIDSLGCLTGVLCFLALGLDLGCLICLEGGVGWWVCMVLRVSWVDMV